MAEEASTPPDCPPSVPDGATWVEADRQWVHGPKDDTGAYHGLVEFWRPDGTRSAAEPHVRGKEHGLSHRFHENGEMSQIAHHDMGVLHGLRVWYACDAPTTEKMRTPDMGLNVVRAEVEYDHGTIVAFRWFDAEGTPVHRNGEPLGPRPPGVPPEALYRKDGTWIACRFDPSGEPDGRSLAWSTKGALVADEAFSHGERHGPTTVYDRQTGEKLSTVQYERGKLEGDAIFFWPGGAVRRRARLDDGAALSLEDWDEAGHLLPPIELPPLTPAPELARPPTPEQSLIAALSEGVPDGLPEALSPAGMAEMIALGWGGDRRRDVVAARAARRIVRALAPRSLEDRLTRLELDRIPRMMLETRVETVLRGLGGEAAIDLDLLEEALARRGGPATTIAMRAGGERALGVLRSRQSGARVDLSGLGLTELSPMVGRLASVEVVSLERNRLRAVPPQIAALVRLRDLRLGHNRVRHLPEELARMTDLYALHLNDNHLDELPPALWQLRSLEVLNLASNALTSLPPEIGALERLETLWLNDNPLTSLPREMTKLQKLTFLHLGNVAWEEPPACLFELESLEDLWIAGDNLKRLPREIARLRNLRALHLWYSSLESMPEELFAMTHLTELRIRDNPLPPGTVERLTEALPGCKIY